MAHIEKYQAPALGNMLAHYDRSAELERGVRRDNIDPARTHLNYDLRPRPDGVSQLDVVHARIASLNLKRAPRKDAVRLCDCIVTMPKWMAKIAPEQQRMFFEATCNTLDQIFGRDNVVSAFVHMDEMTPHVHYAFVPVTDDGRLSAKSVLNRQFMREFHGRLEDGVSQALGIPRTGLTLTEDERGQEAAEYVDLREYKDAKDQADRTAERLEGLRREEQRLQPTAATFTESCVTLARGREVGERERAAQAENRRLRERVSQLEASRARTNGRIAELDRRVREAGERLRGLGERLEDLRNQATELVAHVISAALQRGVTRFHFLPGGLRSDEIPKMFRACGEEGIGPRFDFSLPSEERRRETPSMYHTPAVRPRNSRGLDR